MSEQVLWEQRDGAGYTQLYVDDGEYSLVLHDGAETIKAELSSPALLDLAFAIYEELG